MHRWQYRPIRQIISVCSFQHIVRGMCILVYFVLAVMILFSAQESDVEIRSIESIGIVCPHQRVRQDFLINVSRDEAIIL